MKSSLLPHDSDDVNQEAPQANSTLPNREMVDWIFKLLQDQQELNDIHDELNARLATQLRQLQCLTIGFNDYLVTASQQQPDPTAHQQLETLKQQTAALQSALHTIIDLQEKNLRMMPALANSWDHRLQTLKIALERQRTQVEGHLSFKVIGIQLTYLGIVAAMSSFLLNWVLPGGMTQLRFQIQELRQDNATLLRRLIQLQKHLGIPTN